MEITLFTFAFLILNFLLLPSLVRAGERHYRDGDAVIVGVSERARRIAAAEFPVVELRAQHGLWRRVGGRDGEPGVRARRDQVIDPWGRAQRGQCNVPVTGICRIHTGGAGIPVAVESSQ